MPVTIQDVLALLPELFPGVQKIPMDHIHPNPDNPGPPPSEEQIAEMADDLGGRGLKNPIKARPHPVNPLWEGVTLHPENPRLRGDGKPWEVGDFNWEILSGELRYRGANRLGWKEIDGYILNPTPGEAVDIGHIDNDVRDRGWFADWQTIENRIKAEPTLSLEQVAQRLKMDRSRVSRVYGVLPLLNQASRELIRDPVTNSNKEIWGISEKEKATFQLAGLGPGAGLKPGVRKAGEDGQKLWPYPPIPPETQDLVLRALKVAIDQELTEAGVRGLVGWVQEGHQPEDYAGQNPKAKPPRPLRERAGVRGDDEVDPQPETTSGTSTPHPVLLPQGEKGVTDARETDGEEDEEDFKPIPWTQNALHPERRGIPTSRIRVNPFIAGIYASLLNLELKIRVMKATGYAEEIQVRLLTDVEKGADPDHDFELFGGILTLKGAEALGWPELRAMVYDIDEWEGVRLHNIILNPSQPEVWIENYVWIADRVAEETDTTLDEWARMVQENPGEVKRVLPFLKLLNEDSQKAIRSSINRSFKSRTLGGGYVFWPDFLLPLAPLERISKDLVKTQKLVERVVRVAIESEMEEDKIKELVEWVLAGNDPEKFYAKKE